jgi:hypothetical protein
MEVHVEMNAKDREALEKIGLLVDDEQQLAFQILRDTMLLLQSRGSKLSAELVSHLVCTHLKNLVLFTGEGS